jgi:hypothetical protein
MEGEASRSDLEKTSNLSTLWACLSKVAIDIRLQEHCDLENHDFSNLSEDISRFLGAFLSSVEVIIDSSTGSGMNSNDNIAKVIGTLESIFVGPFQQNRKADLIVQLMREYKDWFNYSYMFNRRVGKHPKNSFEIVNRYYQASRHTANTSHDTSNSTPALESDDDTYKYEEDDDTLGDSFAHENFPAISTPNVAPLNPFSGETYDLPPTSTASRDSSQSIEGNSSIDHEHGSNGIPFVPDEASIINSYYSNWNNVVEEDEDSDADHSFFVARKANKRMTRMKSSNIDQTSAPPVSQAGKKKTKKLTRRRIDIDSDPQEHLVMDRSLNRMGKSVTFADEHNLQLNSSEEFERKAFIPSVDSADGEPLHEKDSDISPPKKEAHGKGRFIFSSVEVTSSNDMVQGFDSNDDPSPPKSNRQGAISTSSSAGPASSYSERRGRANSDSSLELSDLERTRKTHNQKTLDRVQTRVADPWASVSHGHQNHGKSGQRVVHSKLSDDESDDGHRQRGVNPANRNVSHERQLQDPWASNQLQNRRYRNPLDATLEEEEFKTKKKEGAQLIDSTSSIDKSTIGRRNMDISPMVDQSYESVDHRSSSEKPGILSPPVKIPSIHTSPHRYARTDLGSDSEISPLPNSTNAFLSLGASNPVRQEALDRLKKNFLKMKEAKKDKTITESPPGKELRNNSMRSPSSNHHRQERLSLRMDETIADIGICSPHVSPSKARGYARRSSPGSRNSMSSPLAIVAPVRKSDFTESEIQTQRITKQMPTLLVLDKTPAQTINSEVFEMMGGRRSKRAGVAVPSRVFDPPEFRSSVSLLNISVPQTKYTSMSLELPHLQPQTSSVIEQNANRSSSQMLQKLAETVHNVFDRPFQEIPLNADFPNLSELAIQTGIIIEGFLRKRSSMLGLWQKVIQNSLLSYCYNSNVPFCRNTSF